MEPCEPQAWMESWFSFCMDVKPYNINMSAYTLLLLNTLAKVVDPVVHEGL